MSPSGYGERLTAVVALLSGVYRQSHQMLESWMQDLFNIPIAVGSINGLRRDMSESLTPCVEEAKPYVQQQAVRYCDETSFPQGNFDGNNPSGKRAWLWDE